MFQLTLYLCDKVQDLMDEISMKEVASGTIDLFEHFDSFPFATSIWKEL